MSFLQSAQVRAALVEIHELQEKIVSNAITFPDLSVDEQYEHIEDLEELLEKQRLMYTRLSLSDDPEAKEMKNKSASMEELETPNASLKSFSLESEAVTANCKAARTIPTSAFR